MDKPNPNIDLRSAGNKGKGLYATKDIDAHIFITEYTGEVFHR